MASGSYDSYAYPRLRRFTPVLSRGPRALQIGLDQDPTIMLVDVAPALRRVLLLLDGWHRLREIRSWGLHFGVGLDELDWALRTLHDAGLLVEGRSERPTRRAADQNNHHVRLIGAGTLGKSVAQHLVGSGVSLLHVIDNEAPDLGLYPTAGALGTQAEALRAHVTSGSDAQVVVANHWTKPEERRPDLTIIASDFLECDRVIADGLLRADQAHLVLRVRAGGIVVGPLVVPGQTACLRCTDLVRRDADPAWPVLLPQLSRTRLPVVDSLVGWAGGLAAAHTLAFLHQTMPETYGATVEMAPPDYVTRRRAWRMHPACGCGWGSTAQWWHD